MFCSIITAIVLFLIGGAIFKLYANTKWFEKTIPCPKHGVKECQECIQLYGFYIVDHDEIEACADHEDRKIFRFKIPTSNCEKCKVIDIRYIKTS